MATWTATPPPQNSSRRTAVPPILNDQDDAGGASSRLMFTGSAWQFDIKYRGITAAEKDTFESFYTTNAAVTFTLAYRGTNYTVQFTGKGVEFDVERGVYWRGRMTCETVAAA